MQCSRGDVQILESSIISIDKFNVVRNVAIRFIMVKKTIQILFRWKISQLLEDILWFRKILL